MKLSCLIIFVFISAFLACFASAATITTTDVNSTLATVSITNAQNVYSYEITYNVSGDVLAVDFYNFLLNSSDGTSTTNGSNLRGSNISVYESRLDNQMRGITGSGNLFNITHSGNLTLKSVLLEYNNGVEETTNYNPDGTTIVTVITTPGGGGGTVVQHYTLKVISPGDVTLPEEGVIEVPIILQNPGEISLKGIHLSANVSFNNLISNEVKITLGETTIAEIAAGESKILTITINANTKKQGIYKITIYADIDEPKFSDWGEFYIEFKKTSESDADNAITSAEKTLEENVECIELEELVNDAKTLLEERKFTQSAEKIQEFNEACEKAIYGKSPLKGIARSIDYSILLYAALATVIAVAIGIGFYIFKRYKFRKNLK